VQDWIEKGPSKFDSNRDEIMSLTKYGNIHGVPSKTLEKYCHKDPEKRRKIGGQIGTKPLLLGDDQNLIAQIALRKDRANDGMSPTEMIETIQTINPSLTCKQARDHFHRTGP